MMALFVKRIHFTYVEVPASGASSITLTFTMTMAMVTMIVMAMIVLTMVRTMLKIMGTCETNAC